MILAAGRPLTFTMKVMTIITLASDSPRRQGAADPGAEPDIADPCTTAPRLADGITGTWEAFGSFLRILSVSDHEGRTRRT
jgi:hypothetical protein